MKKFLSVLLAAVMVLSLTACGRHLEYDASENENTEYLPIEESSETEEPSDRVISAYMDYIDSYVWVYYLDPSEIPEDGNYDMYEWGSYYIRDIDSDGVPELILVVGTSMASAECLIFAYSSGDVTFVGGTPCAYGVGVAYVKDAPTIVLCEYHGEYEDFTAMTLQMGTVYVASSIPVLPEGSVPMVPTPIGTYYEAPAEDYPEEFYPEEEPEAPEENNSDIPDQELFLECAKREYSDRYDTSGMFVESFWVDDENGIITAMVVLLIPHTYADERMVVEVISTWISSEQCWSAPRVLGADFFMVWNENILGTWGLVGEGLWGGKEYIVFELHQIEFSTAFCTYGIGTVENTFGEVSYSEKYAEGEYVIKEPMYQFGIKDCCPLTQGRTKHQFYLHPDVGVYYSGGASSVVTPQAMTKANG